MDNHCYLKDGSLRLLVESKTYLDRTFLERADNDFAMLQGALCDPDVRTAIVSIENAIAEDAFDFYMGRRNIDRVFFLTKGKRSSKTPLWGKDQYKPLDTHLLQEFIDYVREISKS